MPDITPGKHFHLLGDRSVKASMPIAIGVRTDHWQQRCPTLTRDRPMACYQVPELPIMMRSNSIAYHKIHICIYMYMYMYRSTLFTPKLVCTSLGLEFVSVVRTASGNLPGFPLHSAFWRQVALALFRLKGVLAFDLVVSTFVNTMVHSMICWPRGGPP